MGNNKYDEFAIKELTTSKKDSLEFLKNKKLTEKEIKDISKGNDVFFTYNRLLELI